MQWKHFQFDTKDAENKHLFIYCNFICLNGTYCKETFSIKHFFIIVVIGFCPAKSQYVLKVEDVLFVTIIGNKVTVEIVQTHKLLLPIDKKHYYKLLLEGGY